MDRGVAVVLMAAAGGLIAAQPLVNARLGDRAGDVQGVFISFAVGTVALAVVVSLASGGWGRIGEVRGLSLGWFTGGLMGAVYVLCALVTVRSLGAGGVVAATIAGQLALAMVIDQFGWLGAAQSSITPAKVLGVLFLAAGVALVVRD